MSVFVTPTRKISVDLSYIDYKNNENDLLCRLDNNLPGEYDPVSRCYIADSDEQVQQMIDFWRAECEYANRGENGEILEALTQEEIDNDVEWVLEVTPA